MSDLKLSNMLSLLKNVRQTSNGYTSRCPSHDDNKNSLSLAEGENGKPLLKCFAGCSFQDIIAALNISTNGNGHKPQKQIEAIYDYTDETGKMLYQCVRSEGKDFRWRHYDKTGKEIWNLNGVRRVPYRLAELAKLSSIQDIVMTEGEKDADTLTAHGFPATNHKNWQADFNYLLKGKKVVIFQDHDRTGVEFAEKAARMIFRESEAVKIVDCFRDEPLPDKHGKDVSDYLQAHSIEELKNLCHQTLDWKPLANEETSCKSDEAGLKVVCLSDVAAEEIEWLWKPFIPIGEFTIIEGIEGLGKSWIGCALACAVADGKKLPFSESEPMVPCNVLMLSAEDSLSHTVKPRLLSMRANLERIFAIDEMFSFSDFKDFIQFEAVVAEYEPRLVIIDPMFSYTGGKDLNQESASRPIAAKLIEIAQKYNCAIGGVRHLGKAKGNGDACAAGLGSIAWRASARSVLLVGQDEETGEKAVCQTKSNLHEQAKISIGFEIINGQFLWKGEPSTLTKEKMLAQPKDEETKVEQTEAVEFLREVLRGDGEHSSAEVDKEAKEAKISTYALRKAKVILKVKSYKKGGTFGGEKSWFMKLPETEESESVAEDADIQPLRHLQPSQSDKTTCNNSLAEDVENEKNQHLQLNQETSSDSLVPKVQMKSICKCGTDGFAGERCQSCGEVIIPF